MAIKGTKVIFEGQSRPGGGLLDDQAERVIRDIGAELVLLISMGATPDTRGMSVTTRNPALLENLPDLLEAMAQEMRRKRAAQSNLAFIERGSHCNKEDCCEDKRGRAMQTAEDVPPFHRDCDCSVFVPQKGRGA